MPVYVFRCQRGYRFLVRALMDEASAPRLCPCGQRAERVFTPLAVVMRPPQYSASPGSPEYWQGIHDDPEYLPCQIAKAPEVEALTEEELAVVCERAKEKAA